MIHDPNLDRGWCILRTAGPRTLLLAQSLAAAGLDVWTPAQVIEVRRPRSKMTRERAKHLGGLQRLRNLHASPHPGLSIFRQAGTVPIVEDREIASLRALEAAEAEKRQAGLERERVKGLEKQRHVFSVGERVHVPEGSFTGLTGIVEGGDGKFALICFGGSVQEKIVTFLLRSTGSEVQTADVSF